MLYFDMVFQYIPDYSGNICEKIVRKCLNGYFVNGVSLQFVRRTGIIYGHFNIFMPHKFLYCADVRITCNQFCAECMPKHVWSEIDICFFCGIVDEIGMLSAIQ